MNILIRCDASATIGLGHLMRDLVLAKQFPEDAVSFASVAMDETFETTLSYPLYQLSDATPKALIHCIEAHKTDLLIIDHYSIDAAFERQVKEATGVTLFVLDDNYRPHHCDILLNHNLYGNASRYEGLVPPHCELRCGGEHLLIRDEFKAERTMSREQKGVVIAMGGTDTLGLTRSIAALPPATLPVTLVTSSANPALDELKTFASKHRHIDLYIDTSDMARLLHSAKLAIVSASTLAQEALYLETPLIAIKTADNQVDMVDYLRRHDHMVCDSFDTTLIKGFIDQTFSEGREPL
jgi:UDP-2,4-diacetamido-2,4,6-trideoxy-beta-L-altropyranose hydrolase